MEGKGAYLPSLHNPPQTHPKRRLSGELQSPLSRHPNLIAKTPPQWTNPKCMSTHTVSCTLCVDIPGTVFPDHSTRSPSYVISGGQATGRAGPLMPVRRVPGVLHRVLGLLHRVLGVLHRVRGSTQGAGATTIHAAHHTSSAVARPQEEPDL